MSKKYSNNTQSAKLIIVAILTSSLLVVSGCQKSEDTQTEQDIAAERTDSNVKVTKITPPESDASAADNDTEIAQEAVEITTLNSDLEVDSTAIDESQSQDDVTNATDSSVARIEKGQTAYTIKPATTKPIKAETQITDVEYRDNKGQSIHVTFQTSAVAALEADLMLPSGKRVLLTAPIGQGNNPTYRSKDGNIELVTHGGGGSIDLLYEGKSTKFDAVSADAEVLTPQ